MDDIKRDLFLKVIDDDMRVLDVMYQFDQFKHCDRMLRWLIKEKITGKKFYDLYLNQFKASWLSMGKWVVMKVNGEKEVRAVYAGKDFNAR